MSPARISPKSGVIKGQLLSIPSTYSFAPIHDVNHLSTMPPRIAPDRGAGPRGKGPNTRGGGAAREDIPVAIALRGFQYLRGI